MENCIALATAHELKLFNRSGEKLEEFERLYFGDDFCMHLIPTPEQLRRACRLAREHGCGFTFVTPYVTTGALGRLRAALDLLAELEPAAEVSAADWGVLSMLNRDYAGLTRVLGRTLVRQKAGPRLGRMSGKIPDEAVRVFSGSNLGTDGFAKLVSQFGIARVELENLPQGLQLELDRGKDFELSLHVPYVYTSTSRMCFLRIFTEDDFALADSGKACSKPCLDRAFLMRTEFKPWPQRGNPLSYEQARETEGGPPQAQFTFIYKGNAIYYEHSRLPENLADSGVSRIVHHRFFQAEEGSFGEEIGTIRM